tara:strand:- start:521 stop:793 length:273 start_codon:yes stop_codon:yes gene_type:complete
MPELKFKIDDREYTLFCETGEEDDLRSAVNKVNEKMKIYKEENDISLTKKFLMVSILLASDLNKTENLNTKNKIEEFNVLFDQIEKLLKV